MQTEIVKMINDFEHGPLSRRQLIAHLTGMFAASLGGTIALADQQPGPAAAAAPGQRAIGRGSEPAAPKVQVVPPPDAT